MTNMFDIDASRVAAILLADGWHEVTDFTPVMHSYGNDKSYQAGFTATTADNKRLSGRTDSILAVTESLSEIDQLANLQVA